MDNRKRVYIISLNADFLINDLESVYTVVRRECLSERN